MLDCCILFAHYRDDPITRDHLDRLRRLNPYPVVALGNAALSCVEGTLDVSRLPGEWADEDLWAGADTFLYRWYRHGGLRARRYIFLEWDTLATMPIRDFYAEVWDADAAGSEVKRIEADPGWWFHQRDRLPEHLRRHAAGIVPLNGTLLSDRALAAVAAGPIPPGIFCELRLGTLLRAAGFEPVALPEAKGRMNSWNPALVAFDPDRPGIYHPIKAAVPDRPGPDPTPPSPGPTMRASILIAALNEGEYLAKTVQSCLDTAGGLDCEIVVADDTSTDGSIEDFRRRFPGVRVVAHEERQGVAATKDLAARSSRGAVLVFLDGHCKPEPGALERLVSGVEEAGGDAILIPAVPALDVDRWENNVYQTGHGGLIDLERLECRWLGLDRMRPAGRGHPRPLFEAPTLVGCCLAIGRSLYERLGGFDTDMRMWGIEDLDFGLKTWLMGHPTFNDPAAIIGHRFRGSFDNYAAPMDHVIANQLRMARKHFTDPVWDDWCRRARDRQPAWLWAAALSLFEERRASVERERAYLMAHRVRDEFAYAARFGLPWPATAPAAVAMPTPPPVAPGPDPDPGSPADPRELFLEHYREPRNRQVMSAPDAVGTAESPGGASLTLYLRLAPGASRIERATFQSRRCGVSVAYASLLTDLIRGRGEDEARTLRPADLMGHFGEGAGAFASAALAVVALHRALGQAPARLR